MTAIRLAVEQGSDQWLAVRRQKVTATDIPAILGVSDWKSEADVAAEKLGAAQPDASLRMRLGSHMQGFVAGEYERATGRRTRAVHGLWCHPVHEWAAASPDAVVVGERRLVEVKHSSSRSRWADGLPQDTEAQVRWQLGVSGYPVADVAALVGDDLRVFEVAHDERLWLDLLAVAEGFRARLAAGGPFEHNAESVKRAHPADDGSEIAADAEVTEAVERLIAIRGQRRDLQAAEDLIETALKARMGDAAVLSFPGGRVTWRRSKDRVETDWRAVASDLLEQLPETERAALVGRRTAVREGARYFRVVVNGSED